jgi:hypothetical protein
VTTDIVEVESLSSESGSHVSNHSVGYRLRIVRVDLLVRQSGLPGRLVAYRPFILDADPGLSGEVRP